MKLVWLPLIFAMRAFAADNTDLLRDYHEGYTQSFVKIRSTYNDGSSSLEGSGIPFRWNGKVYVLTSEHVVFPTNDGVTHTAINSENVGAEMEFVDSSWDRGLALLAVKRDYAVGDYFHALNIDNLECLFPEHTVTAYGFPAGSDVVVAKAEGKLLGLLEPGRVLFGQAVQTVKNILAEFGMSGGPAYSGRCILGMVSHVEESTDEKTYFVPIADAIQWIKERPTPVFRRTAYDLRKLFFSASHVEQITHVASGMSFAKNGSMLYIVNAPAPDPKHDDFASIRGYMQRQNIPVLRVWGVNNKPLPQDATLAQLMLLILHDQSKPINFGPQGHVTFLLRGGT